MRIFDPPFPFDINVFQVYFIIFGVILSKNMLMVAAASANSNMFYLPSATRPQLGDVGSAAGHRNLTYLIFVISTVFVFIVAKRSELLSPCVFPVERFDNTHVEIRESRENRGKS